MQVMFVRGTMGILLFMICFYYDIHMYAVDDINKYQPNTTLSYTTYNVVYSLRVNSSPTFQFSAHS
jgi:hypothetical protein